MIVNVEREGNRAYVELAQITVGQLMTALSGLDPSLPVHVEGCDCSGEAAGVEDGGDHVWIFRTNERMQRELEQLYES